MSNLFDKIEDEGEIDNFGQFENEDEPTGERKGPGRPRKYPKIEPMVVKSETQVVQVLSVEQSILKHLTAHVKDTEFRSYKATVAFDGRAISKGHQLRDILVVVHSKPYIQPQEPEQGGEANGEDNRTADGK